jgi:hypothetical protein
VFCRRWFHWWDHTLDRFQKISVPVCNLSAAFDDFVELVELRDTDRSEDIAESEVRRVRPHEPSFSFSLVRPDVFDTPNRPFEVVVGGYHPPLHQSSELSGGSMSRITSAINNIIRQYVPECDDSPSFQTRSAYRAGRILYGE